MPKIVQYSVLVLGGSVDTELLIKSLRKYGCRIIICDQNKNCHCANLGDKFVQTSIWEIDGFNDVVLANGVDYCVTRCSGLPSLICQHINCFIFDQKTSSVFAKSVLDKVELATFCEKIQIDYPSVKEIFCLQDLKKLNGSWVLKPVFEKVGKKTTFLIDERTSNNQLKDFYCRCQKNSQVGRVVLQQFCSGQDISLLGYVNNKNYIAHLLFDENNIFSDGKIAHFGFSKSALKAELFVEIAKKICEFCDTPIVPLNISFRHTEDKIYLIECNLDFGGEGLLDSIRSDGKLSFMDEFVASMFANLQDRKAF